MTLFTAMLISYVPFLWWVIPEAVKDWKKAQKEMDMKRP